MCSLGLWCSGIDLDEDLDADSLQHNIDDVFDLAKQKANQEMAERREEQAATSYTDPEDDMPEMEEPRADDASGEEGWFDRPGSETKQAAWFK